MTVDGDMEQSSKEEKECYHCLIKEYVEQVKECHRNNTKIASGKFLNAVMRHTDQMQVKKTSDGEDFLCILTISLAFLTRKVF